MYFYGSGIWVLIWNNGSQSGVPKSWIVSGSVERVGSFLERQSEIKMNTLDIIGITCGGVSIIYSDKERRSDNNVRLVFPEKEYLNLRIIEKPSTSTVVPMVIVVTVSSVGLLFIVILFGFGIWLWRRPPVDIVFDKLIKDFFNGYECHAEGDDGTQLCQNAESKPYDKSYEISLDNIAIHWDSPLGSGAYGMVLNGTLRGKPDNTAKNNKNIKKSNTANLFKIAVKTVKPSLDSTSLTALLSELKVMIYIGRHENIIGLIGACTEKLWNRELYLILEYCQHGSLQKYLQDNRSDFKNSSTKRVTKDPTQLISEYQNHWGDTFKINLHDLFRWSVEIAAGMNYLAERKVFHGDLAARNVLLDSSLTAKVSDFGLSRRLYERYEYVKQSKEPLPWRWMAPESLRDLTFSTESDVWSFGITLWEIFSLGHVPYSGIQYTSGFIESLETNYRLSKPQYASVKMYDLMLACWDNDVIERPAFFDIVDGVINMLNEIE
ncbi:Vascular endothelial growth factor receptor 3 [Folsomia candida]|uniref:Vascular endothelial growth factor receptor 3 n=2 Tax=Folsomia candida TaxID=158441 RepID=A0A226DQ98_FOLCA|nr:Vascular endothelial growth factor receptor 3 [Folsomia candida]